MDMKKWMDIDLLSLLSMDRITGSSIISFLKRFISSTPCYFALIFFVLHQTALLMTCKQHTVWYFHTKSWYNSKNQCMIVCTVCVKWNLSSQERLPVIRSIEDTKNISIYSSINGPHDGKSFLTRYISFKTNRINNQASVLRIVSRLCMKISNCILLIRH